MTSLRQASGLARGFFKNINSDTATSVLHALKCDNNNCCDAVSLRQWIAAHC